MKDPHLPARDGTHVASTLKRVLKNKSSFPLLLTFILLGAVSSARADMNIGTPGSGAQVVSPVPFSATATSSTGLPITAMKVYLDGNPSEIGDYPGNGTSTLSVNATYAMGVGSHNLTANAWDTGGAL